MEVVHLPLSSAFSKAVFRQIRPHVPRQYWPEGTVRGSFSAAPDGFALEAHFDDLPREAAEQAALWVRRGGVDLLMDSPAAPAAVRMFAAQRWRDACLYGLVPLLFAIPLAGLAGQAAMRLAGVLFALDVAGLLVTHAWLVRRRARLVALRFSADIPSPGLRLSVAVDNSLKRIELGG